MYICVCTYCIFVSQYSHFLIYYGLSLGANNLNVRCAMMGLVELPGLLVIVCLVCSDNILKMNAFLGLFIIIIIFVAI